MNIVILNQMLRNIFTSLISDGYTITNIVSIVLGTNRRDQLTKFINGRDFTIGPLQRILNMLGFDLMIVPIPKDSYREKNNLSNTTSDVMDVVHTQLFDCLDAQNAQNVQIKKLSLIDEQTELLIEQLIEKEDTEIDEK